MLNRIIFLISLLLLIGACSSKKKVQESAVENIQPEWVQSKPFNSSFYYGIGSVNTAIHGSSYQQIAKNKALEDLASEIEVSIDAQSVLSQKESNTAFIENYEATTRIDVENNISEYEVVDTWINQNEYWVLYRLSKEKYKTLEAEKRNAAMSKAMHYLDLNETESNYKLQLDYLLQAIDALKPYLNDPLKTERNNQQVYLGNYTLARINDHLNYLKIIKANDEILLDWNNCYSKEVSFSVQFKDIPADNVPVRIIYNSYADHKVISDNYGLVTYDTKAKFFETVTPEIKAWIKTSDLIKDPMIAALYDSEYSIVTSKVAMTKPSVYIETKYGRGEFQEIIEKSGARLSPDTNNVDVFLKAEFQTMITGKTQDFHTSSCTIKMKVYNKQGQLLEVKTWPSAKGVHTNQTSADSKAIENAIKQIKYSWIQKLIMEHCQR